jgi:hypothetical protein
MTEQGVALLSRSVGRDFRLDLFRGAGLGPAGANEWSMPSPEGSPREAKPRAIRKKLLEACRLGASEHVLGNEGAADVEGAPDAVAFDVFCR